MTTHFMFDIWVFAMIVYLSWNLQDIRKRFNEHEREFK